MSRGLQRLVPIALNQVVTLAFGLIGIKLVGHFVGKAVLGDYGKFQTLVQVGALLTHSGLTNHASRCWQREREHAGAYARFLWSASWRRAWPLAGLILGLSLFLWLTERNPVWLLLGPLLFIGNLSMALLNIANSALAAESRVWPMFSLGAAASIGRAVLPILCVIGVGAGVVSLALGFATHGAIVIAWILGLFWVFRGAAPAGAALLEKWRTEESSYAKSYFVIGIGGWLLQYADRWVVNGFYTEDVLGTFTMAVTIGGVVVNLAGTVMLQLAFPGVFRGADAARGVEDWRRLMRKCDLCALAFLGVVLAGLVTLQAGGPLVVRLLISENYRDSMQMVVPVGLALAGWQINQFPFLLMQGQHNTGGIPKIMLTMAVIKIVGSVACAMVSWAVFELWMCLSVVVVALTGRWLIGRSVMAGARETGVVGGEKR